MLVCKRLTVGTGHHPHDHAVGFCDWPLRTAQMQSKDNPRCVVQQRCASHASFSSTAAWQVVQIDVVAHATMLATGSTGHGDLFARHWKGHVDGRPRRTAAKSKKPSSQRRWPAASREERNATNPSLGGGVGGYFLPRRGPY